MKTTIEITLDWSYDELAQIFSYTDQQTSGLTTLNDYMALFFNQTLARDNFYGAWAEILNNNSGQLVLKMSCAHHNLSPYESLIPKFLAAGKSGVDIYLKHKTYIDSIDNGQVKFLLPNGLSMANIKSVQLLHYPPLETLVYKDYLYSPTNRRWENLIANNDASPAFFSEFESIVDCVPLAAPGGDGAKLTELNNTFTDYVKKMIQARLTAHNGITIPVVAYGGPVMDWLQQAYPKQIPYKLQPLSLLSLRLLDDDTITPVLCANHPSKYLYYTDKPNSIEKTTILTQDLIAAGWQVMMGSNEGESPINTLNALTAYWTDNPRVQAIMQQEDNTYGYNL